MLRKPIGLVFGFISAVDASGMRAWYLDAYPQAAEPDISTALNFSTDYAVPQPAAGEVLIQMKASSVNPIDYKILNANLRKAFPVHLPAIFGCEGAGVVAAIGANNSGRLRVGDHVWTDIGNPYLGAYADFAVSPEEFVALKPEGMSFEEAATIPLVGGTSLQALEKIDANVGLLGKTLLVLGGSGGTGTAAVQLAKNVFGAARVIATTSASNAAFVKSLGADEVIDYHTENWWDVLENGTIHGIYDTVGQEGTAPRATGKLADDGVFLTIVHRGPSVGLDPNPKPNVVQIYHKLSRKNAVDYLDQLKSYVDAGKFRAVVSKTYRLEDLPAAWTESAGGHVQGKLAITNSKASDVLV